MNANQIYDTSSKSLIIKDFSWDDREVRMEVTSYENNNNLAILLYEKETGEYYWDLSVFIKPFENKCFMAVDINNLPNAEDFIQRYNLGELVDYVQSWFVSYPVYDMNILGLSEYDEKWASDFIKLNWDEVLMQRPWRERTVREAIAR